MKKPSRRRFLLAVACLLAAMGASAQDEHAQHQHMMADMSAAPDTRIAVKFPPALRNHTITSMRDHLLALQQIQDALARGAYDAASDIAEHRIGMSSLEAHHAHQNAQFMPQAMQDIGTALHHAASRFATEATNAGVTGDVKPALAALAHVMAQCVACHAGYRLIE